MASAAVVPAGKTNAQRPHAANLYKPVGVKHIQTGIPWVDDGSTAVASKVDLALPIRGFRLVISGRLVIGGADMASVNPEGLLNLLSNIKIEGTNSRQGNSNVTLWDIDLATAWVMQHLFAHRTGHFKINGASVSVPGLPFPSGYAPLPRAVTISGSLSIFRLIRLAPAPACALVTSFVRKSGPTRFPFPSASERRSAAP